MKQTEVGSYILQKMLGEGAFGRVYGGHHKLLPEVKVVIKQEKTLTEPFMTHVSGRGGVSGQAAASVLSNLP